MRITDEEVWIHRFVRDIVQAFICGAAGGESRDEWRDESGRQNYKITQGGCPSMD